MTLISEHGSVIKAADSFALIWKRITALVLILTMLGVNVDIMVTGKGIENQNRYQCDSQNSNIP